MSEMDDVFDPTLLHVNFTDQEASSQAREELPVGDYPVYITEVTPTQCGPESKNPGKWYYNLELTVDKPGSQYDGRKLFTNAMLFEGALYTISQLMKSIPELKARVTAGETQLPTIEELKGKKVIAVQGRGKAQVGTGTKENPQYPARNEVKGFKAFTEAAAKKGGSLLP